MPRKKKTETDEKASARPRIASDPIYEAVKMSLLKDMWGTLGAASDLPPAAPAIDIAKLDALRASEPFRVTQRVPDMMEVITAWRAWRVTFNGNGPLLKALGASDVWEPRKPLEAKCNKGSSASAGGLFSVSFVGATPAHRAPAWDCECGVWSFKDLDRLVAATTKYSGIRVLGNVQLWGRVIETENGYRAQYAYPSELWLLDDGLEELGLIYDVPVRMIKEGK